jgi:S-adenosylmethionine:diacylglycerol 3-amino-3-carboxypropyl transferase
MHRTLDWFDAELDRGELGLGPDDTVFARAGAGDLVLTLLGATPKVVIAAGAPDEVRLLELKLAALKALGHGEFLEFLGAKESQHREDLYQRVRWLMPSEGDAWWQAHPEWIRRGLLWQGDLELGLTGFRRFASLAVGAARLEAFCALDSVEAQREATDRDFRGFLWRRFAERILASAWPGMTRARLEAGMTAGPASGNWALQRILLGRFATAMPFELREENFDALKVAANRVVLSPEPPARALAAMPDGSVDAFALGAGAIDPDLAVELVRAGRPGARLAVRGGGLPGEFVVRGGHETDRGLWPEPLTAATLVVEPAANPT